MTTPTNRQRAEDMMAVYLDALEKALESDNPKAATLSEARRFFEAQGIDVNGGDSGSKKKKADYLRNTLAGLKGERKTGTEE